MAIIGRWNEVQVENLKTSQKKGHAHTDSHGAQNASPKGFFHTRHLSFDERKKLHEERKAKREAERNKIQCQDGKPSCPFCRRLKPHSHIPHATDPAPIIYEAQTDNTNPEFERAIQASVAATSRGDPDEDAMIERAIRASVRELQNDTGASTSSQEALNRAIQASVSAAGHSREQPNPSRDDEEYQAALERSIRDSLASYNLHQSSKSVQNSSKTKDMENLPSAQALTETREDDADHDEDQDIKLAIQRSKTEIEKSSAEEEIVMQYIKKQSLAEEALRLKRLEHQKDQSQKLKGTGKQPEAEQESAADEEALQLAIKESLKSAGGGHTVGPSQEDLGEASAPAPPE